MVNIPVNVHFDDVDFDKLVSPEDFEAEANRLLPESLQAFGKAMAEGMWQQLKAGLGADESGRDEFVEMAKEKFVNDVNQQNDLRSHILRELRDHKQKMSRGNKMASILKFSLEPAGQHFLQLHQQFMPNGKRLLNRTEWRGKEPRSCGVTNVTMPSHHEGQSVPFEITVAYRPKGYITYTGKTKYDGWTAMCLDKTGDGVLLDGKGQPLKDGDEPVWLPFEVYDDCDFNELNFGTFVEETEADPIKRETVDDIMEQLASSGRFSISVHGSFVAPRRNRPLTKIVLSNAPSQHSLDGFGTHIININVATEHLEQVLMERLYTLVCDFIEGRASIANSANDDMTFIELSSSLVDCTPNEHGLDSWFDMLQSYTPIGFLEDLAKRVRSLYAVDVSIVEGKECGIVVRRESSDKS